MIVKPKVIAMDWTKGTGRSSGTKEPSSMMPTAELAPLEPSKGFVEENGVAWPQAAPVHVKTKSAWATNSARGLAR